jgi:transposase
MRPPKQISPEDNIVLKKLLRETRSKADFQRVQCVWMRAELGMNSTEIAAAVGWSKSTVKIVQMHYFREKEQALIGVGRGGRKNDYLTHEEEKNLLESFTDAARVGGVLVVSDIQAAYEREVGRPVAKSTVYRLLARHGWRKIAPRPSHPKSDPAAREEFKKNSLVSSGARKKTTAWKAGPSG